MKTTLELPDDLLIQAKAVAARRKTTLRAMVEHSLRREIGEGTPSDPELIEINARGFPVLKRRAEATVTSDTVYALLDEEGAGK